MKPYILNLLIPQGSSFDTLTFQLRHQLRVRCPAAQSTTQSVIKIDGSGFSMAAGDALLVGCDRLVLAQPLSPLDTQITVNEIPSNIANNATIIAKPIDITNWSFASQIRNRQNVILASFVPDIVDGLNGRFKLKLTSAVTRAIAANCTWESYQQIDIKDLGQPTEYLSEIYSAADLKRIKALTDAAYRWDVESTSDTGSILRRAEGLVLVSGEVTA